MRLLLIEDEKKAGEYIKKGLAQHGFVVDLAENGIDGVFYEQEYLYDIVILDIMLPKLDGWAVLEKIRKRNKKIPVIILTACDDVSDRVTGLNSGADDYLVKPFSFTELLARIQAILRRGTSIQDNNLSFHDISIDLIKYTVSIRNKPIQLTPKEYALLLFFMQRKGRLISRTILAENIWDMHFDSDTNIVDVAIKRLRDKIKIDGKNKLLHTVRGFGYMLEYREGS
jgi:two-component system, OmpR family, copper resistance phosphate regulon response regulator CusR